ncbi:MAG: hypothetical protein AABX05_02180, partial [Nanoarchaeota archaeon]
LLSCAANKYITPEAKMELAQCLVEEEAIMYGADWCGRCRAEKKEFGPAWKIMQKNYVECSEEPQQCEGISSYPFWKFKNGNTVRGYTPNFLEVLAEQSGCR